MHIYGDVLPTGEKIVFEPTYTYIMYYINKGCNFNMNVIHSAPTKSLYQSYFLGYNHPVFVYHKLKHFAIDHNQTFCNITIL